MPDSPDDHSPTTKIPSAMKSDSKYFRSITITLPYVIRITKKIMSSYLRYTDLGLA